ncbi:unnamed protein product [Pleuronectes platessa]|uniref:Uncharacterized protein n=1 Tax=Pleuronectes platessa TaxID=8262 RepID=A0A9N7TSS3_PLEPL|nr:unnamed protein product [Pleuronectes platessa]
MWTTCGRHVDAMWTPCGQHVDAMWTTCDNMWTTCGRHVTTCGQHVDDMWTTCGRHVDAMWTTCGHHVDDMDYFTLYLSVQLGSFIDRHLHAGSAQLFNSLESQQEDSLTRLDGGRRIDL